MEFRIFKNSEKHLYLDLSERKNGNPFADDIAVIVRSSEGGIVQKLGHFDAKTLEFVREPLRSDFITKNKIAYDELIPNERGKKLRKYGIGIRDDG